MINYLVIGIGRMGAIHAENLVRKRVPGARLAAVCDIDSVKLAEFGKKHKSVALFEGYKEAVDTIKPEAVLIATPHYSHTEIAEYCLERGVNVLSEKPQTVTVGDARRINAVADKYPDTLYGIMYNQRTNRMYMRAKELIDGGRLGNILRVTLIVTDWYRSQYYYDMGDWRASWIGEGGGLLINQCVHQLDILQWLVGMPSTLRATAKTVNRNITVENDVTCTMEYPSGATGVFVASGHELRGTNRFEIAGDKGKIVIDKYKMVFTEYEKSEPEVNAGVTKGYGSVKAHKRKTTYGLFRLIRDLRYGQQMRVVARFTEVLSGKAKAPVAYGKEGANALEFINAVYLSAYGGKEVQFPVDADEYDQIINKLKEEESKNVR